MTSKLALKIGSLRRPKTSKDLSLRITRIRALDTQGYEYEEIKDQGFWFRPSDTVEESRLVQSGGSVSPKVEYKTPELQRNMIQVKPLPRALAFKSAKTPLGKIFDYSLPSPNINSALKSHPLTASGQTSTSPSPKSPSNIISHHIRRFSDFVQSPRIVHPFTTSVAHAEGDLDSPLLHDEKVITPATPGSAGSMVKRFSFEAVVALKEQALSAKSKRRGRRAMSMYIPSSIGEMEGEMDPEEYTGDLASLDIATILYGREGLLQGCKKVKRVVLS